MSAPTWLLLSDSNRGGQRPRHPGCGRSAWKMEPAGAGTFVVAPVSRDTWALAVVSRGQPHARDAPERPPAGAGLDCGIHSDMLSMRQSVAAFIRARALRCGRQPSRLGVRAGRPRSSGGRRHARGSLTQQAIRVRLGKDRRRVPDARVAGVVLGVMRLAVAVRGDTGLMVVLSLLGLRSLRTYDCSGGGHAAFSMPA
jgi:hypothetical protein